MIQGKEENRHSQSFTYADPRSLKELWTLLADDYGDTRFLAGGTDLLVKYKRKVITFARLVNLKGIPELREVFRDADGSMRIGALTTLSELSKNPLVSEHAPVLAAAARKMASAQVRNRATVGGNLCNAAPSADLAPPLLVLDAMVEIIFENGQRQVPLADFFSGPGLTILKPGEILSQVVVPPSKPGVKAVYLKQGLRAAMDIAVVGVATKLEMLNRSCTDVAIALGAVAPVPMRAVTAEKWLRDNKLDEESIARAAELAGQAAQPISDVRAEAGYRRELVAALVAKGLRQCALQMEKQGVNQDAAH